MRNTNVGYMSVISTNQLLHEVDSWKRLLEFLQAENVFMKNRLAQITREDRTNQLLDEIERFQNLLIAEDSTISLLRHDVADQEKWVKKEIPDDILLTRDVNRRHKKLRKDLEIAEQKFNTLKFDFNGFFADKTSD